MTAGHVSENALIECNTEVALETKRCRDFDDYIKKLKIA